MKNDFKKLDAQNELASLIQVAPNEADEVIHELVFQAEQIATGNQPLP